jgi:hypothetical protein
MESRCTDFKAAGQLSPVMQNHCDFLAGLPPLAFPTFRKDLPAHLRHVVSDAHSNG